MNFNVLSNKYKSERNVMYAKSGAVATSNPQAAQAGLDILRKGGNAVDAAVATAAALAVTEPTSNGIGGDAYSLVWIESEKKLYGLNSSGFAPELMTKEAYKGLEKMPRHGFGAITVPGIPAAWAELNKKFGKLSLYECLKPAIDYAREGYIVYPNVAKLWEESFEDYSNYLKELEKLPKDRVKKDVEAELVDKELLKEWFDTFTIDGKVPQAGDIFKCEEQAKTLEEIANTGAESFYRGRIAELIDEHSRKFGGMIRKSDLEKYYPQWVEPISTNYKGYDICEIPPNGHGITVLIALNILKELELDEEKETVDNIHKMIECMKLAFADSKKYVTDPKKMTVSVDAMLNQEYAKRRSELIGEKAVFPEAGEPFCGGTVYMCTADKDGNMVSHIQSNYMNFGSGVVIPGTGIALHNRGNNFSLDENHDNIVEPFKKPYHTIIPGFIKQDGEAVGAFGVMGAFMQPQGQFQAVTNLIDFAMNPQEALDAPRWQWIDGMKIEVEDDMKAGIAEGLKEKGHDVKVVSDKINMGRGQIILKNEKGGYICGTEKRCDGHVAVY
ncbi:gamma-glutamyltransferase family protein [Peptacetobacter sp. AB800]|uniref:gamma-glutamyltransferase family protein n=1 Tax=Peptacetobacter sp. AB800 TaxID=3388428 RepID=UPI0039FC238A